jgi:hypothetical protein
MSKYEEGLPPVNQKRKHDEREERGKYEESTDKIKFELEIPPHLFEECKRAIRRKHLTISRYTLSRYIMQCISVGVQVDDLINLPGTTIISLRPDGSERLIDFVLDC